MKNKFKKYDSGPDVGVDKQKNQTINVMKIRETIFLLIMNAVLRILETYSTLLEQSVKMGC